MIGLVIHDEPVRDDAIDRVIEAFPTVTGHGEVELGLRELRRAGVTVVTMTNGTVEVTRNFLHREGLDSLVDATYDVREARRWKPAPDPCRHVLDQHAIGASDAALIAVHPWDIHGARQAGLAAAWVDRAGHPYRDAFRAPTAQARSFDSVVERLMGSAE